MAKYLLAQYFEEIFMIIEEIIGYAASILVAISLLSSNVIRLRIINLIGALTFVIYGMAIQAYPVAFMNGFIVIINIYYLRQFAARKDYFGFLPEVKHSMFVAQFLSRYTEDIRQSFPEFDYPNIKNPQCIFILRNLIPVGLFIYEVNGNVAEIKLDYVIKDFRDFKNAFFLYSRTEEIFGGSGVTRLSAQSSIPSHQKYLRKMKFQQDTDNPTQFWRDISPNR